MAGTDMTSYGATTTTYSSAIKTKWEQKLLDTAEGYLVADKFARTKVMGRGEGGTLKLNRLLRPAAVTSADSEGYLYNYDDAKSLSTNYIDCSPSFWGDSFGFTDKVDIVSFISDADNRDVIANQMARSLDYQVMKTIATGCLRHRIDKDATNQVSGTVTTANSAGTSLVSTALTQIDDHWNGGYATITSPDGGGYDETSKVTDFDAASDTATVSFTNGLTTSSDFRLTVGTDLAATDTMSITGLLDVSALHRKLETQKFSGGLLRGFMDAAQERDLWDDTTFLNSAIYDSSERFKNYRVGRWLDIEFLVTSNAYREDVDGTENKASGVVYVMPIFGDYSYSVVRWGMGQGDFGVDFHYVDKPDSGNLRMGAKWISWKAFFASKVLRATSIVGLMTGATDMKLVNWA